MPNASNPTIVYFTGSGKTLARKIAKSCAGEVQDCSASGKDAKQVLHQTFAAGIPIIGICASGILMRILAPLLDDKFLEPPVISISAKGEFVVPLLGGHRGANDLAKEIASKIGAKAVITTASDEHYEFALDEPPNGYFLANPEKAKSVMAGLLNGEKLQVTGEGSWLKSARYPIAAEGSILIEVGEKLPGVYDGKSPLYYHPKTLVAGIGCARYTPVQEIIEVLENTLISENLSLNSLAAIASIDIKSDEAGLVGAAAHFGVPLRFFTAEQLASQREKIPNPSPIVERETGTPSVAEAAALFAGELIVAKQKTKNVTCAIGKAPLPIDISEFGQFAGKLHLVGIGPGESIQRTDAASQALSRATDWVGYGLYLDLIADLHNVQNQHRFDLGDEEVRVRFALELAAQGKTVALVCSGDAQIYAMAALVYELLETNGKRAVSKAAKRIAVESHPGISALQMASARAGALLGHDFCTISLSDLLTPRPDIERRLLAAATGDFVTAFYNPRSKKRTDLIQIAKDIFLKHRPPETPVIIASQLGREGEQVRVVDLQNFDPAEIDMLTIVLFGSSNSKSFLRGDGKTVAFTPRGYANKKDKK